MSELFLPCPVASWNELEEIDDQTKHCKDCGIHVYNQKATGARCGIDNSDSDELSYLQFIMRFTVILVLAFGSSLFSGVYAQETLADPSVQKAINTTTIRGQVFDEAGEEMPAAFVSVEENEKRIIGVVSDLEGIYRIDIPDSLWKDDKLVLSFKYAGYPTTLIELKKPDEKEVYLNAKFSESTELGGYPIGIYMPLIDVDPDSKRMTTISGKDIRIMHR